MIKDAILNFPKQFAFEPEIENLAKFRKANKFIVVGMGGSGLVGGLLKIWNPGLDLIVHRNYGLPNLPEGELAQRLIILSSYSGNTEEVLDAFNEGLSKNLSMIAVSAGGELVEQAKKYGIPHILIPDTGLQPRMALGFGLKALSLVIGDKQAGQLLSDLAASLKPEEYEAQGRELAQKLKGSVPIIYSSRGNFEIAYNWKIKFNETGKIPAFCNRLPELNHNEMTGFDAAPNTKALSDKFYFIFLRDKNDHPRIIKRMDVLRDLYAQRGLRVEILNLEQKDVFYKIFASLILADWTAYYAAMGYGVEPEQVPMVEEFKKLMK